MQYLDPLSVCLPPSNLICLFLHLLYLTSRHGYSFQMWLLNDAQPPILFNILCGDWLRRTRVVLTAAFLTFWENNEGGKIPDAWVKWFFKYHFLSWHHHWGIQRQFCTRAYLSAVIFSFFLNSSAHEQLGEGWSFANPTCFWCSVVPV